MGANQITDKEIEEIENRCKNATEGPWVSYVEGRDHTSGSNFIMRGNGANRKEDLELIGATVADQDFIANARQDIPRLLGEIARLRSLLDG